MTEIPRKDFALDASSSARERAPDAGREKRIVALSSVVAAVFLTSMKVVVGLATGSLGILSEAAHSALDLVAAGFTFFAVRVSGRPADREHTYGHGKVENLSALLETGLLLVTCVWIIYEAIQRLFFRAVHVEATVWSFLVMATSIVIDVSRSRALYRVARKYKSQALEADALHFSTDVWSSTVVIGGLALVWLSRGLRLEWLAKADAVAAIGVAGIVAYVSVQLGRRTIAALVDEIPSGLREEVASALRIPGVTEVRRVRMRTSGPETFVDVTVAVRSDTSLDEAHDLATQAEKAVRATLPGADVVVHVEPASGPSDGIVSTVRLLAARHGLSAHGIRVYDLAGTRTLELHLEVSDHLRLDEAHDQATALEKDLYENLPNVNQIQTHLEPIGEASVRQKATRLDEKHVLDVLEEIARERRWPCLIHEAHVHRVAGEISLSFHCGLAPETSINEAHRITEQVEKAVRARIPSLGRVLIHVEPADEM
jgi:cation diffusion facilitator family transporter